MPDTVTVEFTREQAREVEWLLDQQRRRLLEIPSGHKGAAAQLRLVEAARSRLSAATSRTDEGAFVFVDPPNKPGLRIDSVWLYVSVDDVGDEGVCAAPLGSLGMVPLMAADQARLASLGALARHVAMFTEKRVRLIRLHQREDLDWIDPA